MKCFLNILAVVYFDFYAFISSFPLFVFTVLETFWFGVISTNPLLLTFVFITFLTFSNVIRIGDLKMKKWYKSYDNSFVISEKSDSFGILPSSLLLDQLGH